MTTNDAASEVVDRMTRNARMFSQNYASANDLLNAAVGESVPWVMGLPAVRGKIPPMFRNALPKGAPVTLDKIERLATQLLAILAASYETDGPGNEPDGLAKPPQAKIINLQGAMR